MRAFLSFLIGGVVLASAASAYGQEIDWQKIDATLGRKPAVAGDVHRYGFPRTDLTVTLDGVTIKPAFALGGWVAFKPARSSRMASVIVSSENGIPKRFAVSGRSHTQCAASQNDVKRSICPG